MCHFITLVLPANSDLDSVSAVLARHHRKAQAIVNAHLIQQLQPGEKYIYPSGKMCDCGTALGALRRKADPPRVERRTLDDLRKKGWSETKVQRWLEQQQAIYEREARLEATKSACAQGSDPDGWSAILTELSTEARLPYVGLLLHWYSRGLNSERIHLSGRIRVAIDSEFEEILHRMEEDTLYHVAANQKRSVKLQSSREP